MELYFLGRGSAFNTKEGNTAAFFIEGRTLFLLDCGRSVYDKLNEINLLEYAHIEEIFVFITHLHSDHCGSLSDLIYHCKYFDQSNPIKINVVCHELLRDELYAHLEPTRCTAHFKWVKPDDLALSFASFSYVRFLRTTHQTDMLCCSIEFETPNGKLFYSGDTNDLDAIERYVKQSKKIDKLFIEVTSVDYPGNVHLPLYGLDRVIPQDIRHKTYLMHFNNDDCIRRARELGFQIVEVVR